MQLSGTPSGDCATPVWSPQGSRSVRTPTSGGAAIQTLRELQASVLPDGVDAEVVAGVLDAVLPGDSGASEVRHAVRAVAISRGSRCVRRDHHGRRREPARQRNCSQDLHEP